MEKESRDILEIIAMRGIEVIDNVREHTTLLLPEARNKDAEEHIRRILQNSALRIPKIIMKEIGIDTHKIAALFDNFGAYAYVESVCTRTNLDVKLICGEYAPNAEFSVTLAIILDITTGGNQILEITKLIFKECFTGDGEKSSRITQLFRQQKTSGLMFSQALTSKVKQLNTLGKAFMQAQASKLLQRKMMENGLLMSNNEFRRTTQRLGNYDELDLALQCYQESEALNSVTVEERQGNETTEFIKAMNYELEHTPHVFFATVKCKKLGEPSYDSFLSNAITSYQIKINKRLMSRQRVVDKTNNSLEHDFILHQRTTGIDPRQQARDDADNYYRQKDYLEKSLTKDWGNFRLVNEQPHFPFGDQQRDGQLDINPEKLQNANPEQEQQNNPENSVQKTLPSQQSNDQLDQQKQKNLQAQNNVQNENKKNNETK